MAGDEKTGEQLREAMEGLVRGQEKNGVVADGEPVAEVRRLHPMDGAQPEIPVEHVEPRLRLGTLIRRARASSGTKLEDLAETIGMSPATVMQIENGNLTIAVEKLQQIAVVTGCDFQALVNASRDFQTALFSDPSERMTVESIAGRGARVLAMPPEQMYVEYREGWFAGASGRSDPGDMSPAWQDGHESGRLAMENALHAKRAELDIHYGDGERGAPT